jgi:methyl-accepting chemotaxis protein
MSFRPRIASASTGEFSLQTEFQNFLVRWKVIETGLSNLADSTIRKRVSRAIRDLEVLGPSLERHLSESDTPEAEQIRNDFNRVNAVFLQKRQQIKTAVEESEYQYAQAATPLHEALIADDDDAEAVEYLRRQTSDILGDMRQLNDITQQVGALIQDQHQTVVKVDDTIESAVGEMKAGNQELQAAEKDQKSGGKMLYIVLGVVLAVALVIGGVCVYFFVIKKT